MARTAREDHRFDVDELFFSTTDRKGIITSGNEVFMRVAGYSREELVGKAHNRVRHPDMPRAAFKLLWEYLDNGQPFAAYVKNRRADGSAYWVIAVVVPLVGAHLSVRMKPSNDQFFEAAQAIYAEARSLERSVEGDNPRMRKESIEAGKRLILDRLRGAGFNSYSEFMHAALPAEVTSREGLLGSEHSLKLARVPWRADAGLKDILESCGGMHKFISALLGNLEHYAELNRSLPQKAAFILDLAEEVRLFALNARLAATRLEESGSTLAAIAAMMRERSDEVGPLIEELGDDILATVDLLGDMGFRIAATKLQAEMILHFVGELLHGEATHDTMSADLNLLAETLSDGVGRMFTSLSQLDERLATMTTRVNALERELGVIQTLEMNGRIEATRAPEASSIRALFANIGKHVRTARGELSDFGKIGGELADADGAEDRVMRQLEHVQRRVAALDAA